MSTTFFLSSPRLLSSSSSSSEEGCSHLQCPHVGLSSPLAPRAHKPSVGVFVAPHSRGVLPGAGEPCLVSELTLNDSQWHLLPLFTPTFPPDLCDENEGETFVKTGWWTVLFSCQRRFTSLALRSHSAASWAPIIHFNIYLLLLLPIHPLISSYLASSPPLITFSLALCFHHPFSSVYFSSCWLLFVISSFILLPRVRRHFHFFMWPNPNTTFSITSQG